MIKRNVWVDLNNADYTFFIQIMTEAKNYLLTFSE